MQKIFEYEAIVESGESVKSTFKGTKDSFEKMLSQKKLTLIALKEIKEKQTKANLAAMIF